MWHKPFSQICFGCKYIADLQMTDSRVESIVSILSPRIIFIKEFFIVLNVVDTVYCFCAASRKKLMTCTKDYYLLK